MPNLDFTLTGEFVELHNLLKLTGLADSGGSAKMIVASGAVKVDGAVELRKTCKVRAGRSCCSATRASPCTARHSEPLSAVRPSAGLVDSAPGNS
ncbi:hypothetical protein BMMON3_37570 [Burkholderia mallei]